MKKLSVLQSGSEISAIISSALSWRILKNSRFGIPCFNPVSLAQL